MEEINILEKANRKCPSCGGNMIYSPEHCALLCENCDTTLNIKTTRTATKHKYNEGSTKDKEHKEWEQDNKAFQCSSCGALISLKDRQISSSCPYCGASYATKKEEIKGLIPDGIIPFKLSNEKATTLYKNGVKRKPFLPNKFKKAPPVENIKGIYIPCFAYDAETNSNYSGKLGTRHTRRDSDGSTSTYTTYEYISGSKSLAHKNIAVETSAYIDQPSFNAIKPYKYDVMEDFNNDFILGYSVESYTHNLDICKKIADAEMDRAIERAILANYNYDFVSYLNVDTTRYNEMYAYYLLPIYECKYSYKNKSYVGYMNGQTGKVAGAFPLSYIKIGLLVFAILSIVALIITLVIISD